MERAWVRNQSGECTQGNDHPKYTAKKSTMGIKGEEEPTWEKKTGNLSGKKDLIGEGAAVGSEK